MSPANANRNEFVKTKGFQIEANSRERYKISVRKLELFAQIGKRSP